ncbi:MAG: hypothetical protein KDK64_07550 [Chlamydiia bacterium]|nr:hypothetical protein [Chlamydiia bacterium]
MEWSEKDEITFSFEKLKPELQEALSFVPFFQEEALLTQENVSWFIKEWNALNRDHTVDAIKDPVKAILEIREHMIELGAESFIKGVGLYAVFSPRLTHIAQQILGHAPRDDDYDQTMINWYVKLRA